MEKFIEHCCAEHLDQVLEAKIHSESPLVLSIQPCPKCIEEATFDNEMLKEALLEKLKEELS